MFGLISPQSRYESYLLIKSLSNANTFFPNVDLLCIGLLFLVLRETNTKRFVFLCTLFQSKCAREVRAISKFNRTHYRNVILFE